MPNKLLFSSGEALYLDFVWYNSSKYYGILYKRATWPHTSEQICFEAACIINNFDYQMQLSAWMQIFKWHKARTLNNF